MYGVGAAHAATLFCLEPEPTQFGRSQSWLRELGLPELDGAGDGQKSGSSATLPKSQNYFFRSFQENVWTCNGMDRGAQPGKKHLKWQQCKCFSQNYQLIYMTWTCLTGNLNSTFFIFSKQFLSLLCVQFVLINPFRQTVSGCKFFFFLIDWQKLLN